MLCTKSSERKQKCKGKKLGRTKKSYIESFGWCFRSLIKTINHGLASTPCIYFLVKWGSWLLTGDLPFCQITADHQLLRSSARGEWRKVCSWEIRVCFFWLSSFVVLIILKRRSATPSHTTLPFTHNTLTFSFACLCRHCPIRIHHTHRLSHADFDAFFFFFLTLTIVFFLLSGSFCLFHFFSSSFLHSYLSSWVLPLSQQHRQILDESPGMSDTINPLCLFLSSLFSPRRCSFIPSLSLKGQRREWHLSTWTLPLLLFFSSVPLFHLPHLRQSDIYKGTLHLLGSPCSFCWKNTKESGR